MTEGAGRSRGAGPPRGGTMGDDEKERVTPGPTGSGSATLAAALALVVGAVWAMASVGFSLERVPEPAQSILGFMLALVMLLAVGLPVLAGLAVVLAIRALLRTRRQPGQRRAKAVAIASFLVCGAYLASIPWAQGVDDKGHARSVRCAVNLHALIVVMRMYAEEHGGLLPPARRWCDELKPYIDDPSVFVCPAARRLRCGYAFNAALGGMRYDEVRDQPVVAIFESDAGWNAAGGPELLPKKPRHPHGVDLYAFAGGNGEQKRRGTASELRWKPAQSTAAGGGPGL